MLLHRQYLMPVRGSILILVVVLLTVLVLLATMLAYLSKLETRSAENAALSIQARMCSVSGVAGTRRLLAAYAGAPVSLSQKWSRPAPLLLRSDEPTSVPVAPAARVPAAESVSAQQTPLASSDASVPGKALASSGAAATSATASASGNAIAGRIEIADLSARIDVNALMPFDDETTRPRGNLPAVTPRLPAKSLEDLIAAGLSQIGDDPAGAGEMARAILAARLGLYEPPGDAADNGDSHAAPSVSLLSATTNRATAGRSAGVAVAAETVEAGSREDESAGIERSIRNLGSIKTIARMPDALWEAVSPHLTTFSSCSEEWRPPSGEESLPRAPLNTASPTEIYDTLKLAYPQAPEALLKQFAVNLVDRRDADSLPSVYDDGGVELYPVIGYEKTVTIDEVCPDVMTPSSQGDNGEYVEICNPLDETVDLTSWTLQWGESQTRLELSLPPGAVLIVTDDIKDDNDPTPEDDQPGMGSFYEVFKIMPYNDKTLILEVPNMNLADESGAVRLLDSEGRLIDYLAYESATFNGINRGFKKRTPFAHRGVGSAATPFKADLAAPPTPYERLCRDILSERMNEPFQTVAEVLAVSAALPEEGEKWVFPAIDSAGSTELGLLLLDCLTESDTPGPALGKINLNTASREVLEAVPGLDGRVVDAIVAYRDAIETQARSTGSETAPFVSLSDFAAQSQVWSSRSPEQRLESLLTLCPLATTTSNAFAVTTTAFVDPRTRDANASGVATRALVNLQDGGTQIVGWEIVPPR